MSMYYYIQYAEMSKKAELLLLYTPAIIIRAYTAGYRPPTLYQGICRLQRSCCLKCCRYETHGRRGNKQDGAHVLSEVLPEKKNAIMSSDKYQSPSVLNVCAGRLREEC